jgi:hypothetical protein
MIPLGVWLNKCCFFVVLFCYVYMTSTTQYITCTYSYVFAIVSLILLSVECCVNSKARWYITVIRRLSIGPQKKGKGVNSNTYIYSFDSNEIFLAFHQKLSLKFILPKPQYLFTLFFHSAWNKVKEQMKTCMGILSKIVKNRRRNK